MYPIKIYNDFRKSLEDANIVFNENRDEGIIFLPNEKIDSTLKGIGLMIEVREYDYVVQGIYQNFEVSKENSDNVAELLTKINDLYFFPQLIFNFSNNTVWCRIRTAHFGDDFNQVDIVGAIKCVIDHLEKFGNSILGVSLGLQSADDAFKKIASNDSN